MFRYLHKYKKVVGIEIRLPAGLPEVLGLVPGSDKWR